MDHDQNFKNLIIDYPREALKFIAADEAESIDAAVKVVPVRQEQLKQRLGDRFRELDVPLMVEWPGGRREALLFVVEEESDSRRFSIHRLAHYCLDLAEMFEIDRVVPVVIFLRNGNYRKELHLGSEHHTYLSFTYLECNLSVLSSERYLDIDNIVARLNLPNMDYSQSSKVDIYAQAVRGLFELESRPEKQLKYLDFIDIYAALNDNEISLYQQKYPEEVEKMATWSERTRQEGIQQGLQQGEAAVLIRQLRKKFGNLPDEQRQRIETADTETLLEWSERILTAESIDEVLH